MAREMRFRSWDSFGGKMVYFDFNNLLEKQDELFSVHGVVPHSHTIMQYTGLKDKNGKEIYEGDIILNDDGQKAIVRYDESAAGYYLDFYELMGSGFCVCIEKVIGNIYEHPHLLEGK